MLRAKQSTGALVEVQTELLKNRIEKNPIEFQRKRMQSKIGV